MRPNTVKRAWRDGERTIGAWLGTPSAHVAESMAHAGFDWLCIDMQHGVIDYNDTVEMLRGISTTDTVPFVRVPWNDPPTLMKALDAGAYGVVIPLVNNREEAERAVWACRYPPRGGRSFGPARATMYAGEGYVDEANDEIAVICMIETAEALDNLDDILSVEGVDCAYIGPSDLAFALGMRPAGDNPDPTHQATVLRVLDACRRHGVTPGCHTGSLEYATKWLDAGFQMVTLGQDSAFMRRAADADLAAAREQSGVAPVRGGAAKRRALPPEQRDAEIRELRERDPAMTQETIAARVGASQSLVSKVLRLNAIRAEIPAAAELPDIIVMEVMPLPREQQVEIMNAAVMHGWAHSEVRAVRAIAGDDGVPREEYEAVLAGDTDPIRARGGE